MTLIASQIAKIFEKNLTLTQLGTIINHRKTPKGSRRKEETGGMRKKLQTLREGAGYTQQTFSERLGVSRSHYAQIESGDKNPSLKLSLKIKQALGYPYDDLFFNPKRPVSRH